MSLILSSALSLLTLCFPRPSSPTIFRKYALQTRHMRHPNTFHAQLIRDGNHTVTDLMSIGTTMLGRRHVLPSVVSTLTEIQVEGTFPTGTYLVTVHHPISSNDGNIEKALYGSFLPIPDRSIFKLPEEEEYEAN